MRRYSHSHSRSLAPAKHARINTLGLWESSRCVRTFCEWVRVVHTLLAIICTRARNVDSRTFEMHYRSLGISVKIESHKPHWSQDSYCVVEYVFTLYRQSYSPVSEVPTVHSHILHTHTHTHTKHIYTYQTHKYHIFPHRDRAFSPVSRAENSRELAQGWCPGECQRQIYHYSLWEMTLPAKGA